MGNSCNGLSKKLFSGTSERLNFPHFYKSNFFAQQLEISKDFSPQESSPTLFSLQRR